MNGQNMITPQYCELIDSNTKDRDKRAGGNLLARFQVISQAFGCEVSDSFGLGCDTSFTWFHLLPLLSCDGWDGRRADAECARDCTLGITVGECVYDLLPSAKRTELCGMTL